MFLRIAAVVMVVTVLMMAGCRDEGEPVTPVPPTTPPPTPQADDAR